ncbi:PKD domain-containing protein [Methanosarcina hadiensis]|uniref:PKD domain-containing protein n=1 Tax=Methanosarcina hadiensis TaxID=3078083 RepID=UPI003977C710
MKNKGELRSIPLAMLVLLFFILGTFEASAGTETRLTNGERLTSSIAIYGNIVTWSETAGNGVHVYDLASGKIINAGYSWGGNIPVYGNKIVWADIDENIMIYDISTDNGTRISSNGSSPDIYENDVVYSKNYYSDQDHQNYAIYLHDFNTGSETKIAAVHSYPAIYDKTVVWSQANGSDSYDICKYDIFTNQTSVITTINSSYISRLDIYDNITVWEESGNVYMCDLASGKKTQITNNGDTYEPAIYGKRIVYTEGRLYGDIYTYDISTAKKTRITTSNAAFSPSIYEDKILYADSRDSEYSEARDLYLYDLSSTVQSLPVAEFSANVTSGTMPLVVRFTDISTGAVPTSWYWDFGDGIYSKHAMNATHTFTDPGIYDITLTAANEAGNSTVTKPGYITVTPPQAPVADFSTNVTSGPAPLTVLFAATDKGGAISEIEAPASWYWDFGDGINSRDSVAVHTFTKPGNYTISLTVENIIGNNTTTRPGYIVVTDPDDFGCELQQ